ncbi:MAG: fibronectin type III-like domain-contianing protein, partial [Terriglobales bacterium]
LEARLTVRNRGAVSGTAVPQVYLGAPQPAPAGAQFAVRALAGFTRMSLAPGQSRTVVIHIPRRQLAYWAQQDHAWRAPYMREHPRATCRSGRA